MVSACLTDIIASTCSTSMWVKPCEVRGGLKRQLSNFEALFWEENIGHIAEDEANGAFRWAKRVRRCACWRRACSKR